MTDLDRARQLLPGHSIALCRGEKLLTDDARGIAPMTESAGGRAGICTGFCRRSCGRQGGGVAVCPAGIVAVYAATLSCGGRDVLATHGIRVEYGILTDCIRNRAGTGVCPMEQAVSGVDDPEIAYRPIGERLSALRAGQ